LTRLGRRAHRVSPARAVHRRSRTAERPRGGEANRPTCRGSPLPMTIRDTLEGTAMRAILIGILAACVTGSALAHHSPTMLYDMSREITMQGVVTAYTLGNPHLRIYFDVDKNGRTEKWMAEGGSRTVLMRKG